MNVSRGCFRNHLQENGSNYKVAFWKSVMFKVSSSLILAFAIIAGASAQTSAAPRQRPSPFAPPRASLHYALDRTCDLQNVNINIDIDYPNRSFTGTVVNTFSPLRSGLTEVMIMAGIPLNIASVKVDGITAKYRREGRLMYITVPTTRRGNSFKIAIDYNAKNSKARPFGGGGGGFHWIEPTATNATKVGFWTQGESETNSEWCPTWDYPNDLATSETHCTVQSDWDMIGNGALVDTKLSPDKTRKTYHWKMSQPHATYLLTLVGGPFDIKKDNWEGIDLWYVTPRGEGYLIGNSFANTKDMLSFYSKAFGVKYPWPKYAQLAMYDFGGGMENVSATTLGEGSLTEPRDGYFRMDSLNSHELGHQWFGDYVTCKDWGDTWLNESFATILQDLYFEHSRGKDAYDWEIDDNMKSYFVEARQYKRPISTKMYPNGDAMFDSHTYPKGGSVLHTLRKMIGDEAFFGGLNYYLTKWAHTPVESAQLRRAFTEYSGINVEPFWAQWFDKPGHPVIDYSWVYDAGKVKLTVKQIQDISDGTPVYDVNTSVDLISDVGSHTVLPVHLTKSEETFEIASGGKPGAVVFDPEHVFLREIPKSNWSDTELPLILKFGKNAPDRAEAMRRMIEKPTTEGIQMIVEALTKDSKQFLVFRNVTGLVNLVKPELRSFWMKQLDHPNFDRRASAVSALAKLPPEAETTAKFKSLVNDKAPIQVVVGCIGALANWDKAGNNALFKAAQNIKDRRGRIKAAADRALDIAKGQSD
jgi:aminopeptidase N